MTSADKHLVLTCYITFIQMFYDIIKKLIHCVFCLKSLQHNIYNLIIIRLCSEISCDTDFKDNFTDVQIHSY